MVMESPGQTGNDAQSPCPTNSKKDPFIPVMQALCQKTKRKDGQQNFKASVGHSMVRQSVRMYLPQACYCR